MPDFQSQAPVMSRISESSLLPRHTGGRGLAGRAGGALRTVVRALVGAVAVMAVVACTVLVFGFVAFWDWIGTDAAA